MHITRINNVRSGDLVQLECNGLYWCYIVEFEGTSLKDGCYKLVAISEDEYRKRAKQ